MTLRTMLAVMALMISSGIVAATAAAQEPSWSGRIITFGDTRAAIESTPIIHRSYRPMHFYGNTVRRRYYRGTAVPSPRDFAAGSATLFRGR